MKEMNGVKIIGVDHGYGTYRVFWMIWRCSAEPKPPLFGSKPGKPLQYCAKAAQGKGRDIITMTLFRACKSRKDNGFERQNAMPK